MLQKSYVALVEKRNCIFENSTEIETRITQAARWLCSEKSKVGLLLYGKCGNGKTTLARAICETIGVRFYSALSTERKSVRQISAFDLIKICKVEDDFERTKNVPMLFIDDVGCEPLLVKSWGNDTSPLVELLLYRYDKMLFTIFSSNLTDTDMRERYGERAFDRMIEIFDRLPFLSKSFRK